MAFSSTIRATVLDKLTPVFMLLIVAGVVGASYFFIFQQEVEKFVGGGALHKATGQETLQKRTAYLSELKNIEELYAVHGKNSASPVSLILPSKPDIPNLFVNFEELAKRRGVGLQVINVSDADTRGSSGITEMTVTLKFMNVDYSRLKDVLRELEQDARLIDVLSFSFDPGAEFLSVTARMYAGS
jgi:Tfp pilus assembly protein PilO